MKKLLQFLIIVLSENNLEVGKGTERIETEPISIFHKERNRMETDSEETREVCVP